MRIGTHIDISLGFEVDYIPGFESDIQEFLDRYGPLTDDNIFIRSLYGRP